jgi:hypothetical protein
LPCAGIGCSQDTFLQFGKAQGTFVPPLSDHGKIVEIFFKVLVFREREDDSDLVSFLVNYILFYGSDVISRTSVFIPTME